MTHIQPNSNFASSKHSNKSIISNVQLVFHFGSGSTGNLLMACAIFYCFIFGSQCHIMLETLPTNWWWLFWDMLSFVCWGNYSAFCRSFQIFHFRSAVAHFNFHACLLRCLSGVISNIAKMSAACLGLRRTNLLQALHFGWTAFVCWF